MILFNLFRCFCISKKQIVLFKNIGFHHLTINCLFVLEIQILFKNGQIKIFINQPWFPLEKKKV